MNLYARVLLCIPTGKVSQFVEMIMKKKKEKKKKNVIDDEKKGENYARKKKKKFSQEEEKNERRRKKRFEKLGYIVEFIGFSTECITIFRETVPNCKGIFPGKEILRRFKGNHTVFTADSHANHA